MRNRLIEAMEKAIWELRQWPEKTVHIFHHNDADGLSSGAILTRAFERQRFEVHRFCLEKTYPPVLEKIYEQEGKIIIFADFGGRIAPTLSQLNRGRNLTLILDHHAAQDTADPKVHNLDPELYGLKGDRDISASTTCYLFASIMDPSNRDLAHIAVMGAVGDGFFVEGRIVSQNREVAMEAVYQGLMDIEEYETDEHYILKTAKGDIPYDEFAAYLDILGGVGYYQNGPHMGVRVCLDGISPESDRMVEELKIIKTRAFETEIARLKNSALKVSSRIQWFHVANRFTPMGVKLIGTFCNTIKKMSFVDPEKYIAGFQIIPNEIPGFGPIAFNGVKISMRVPPSLEKKVRENSAPGLDMLLPKATDRLGGFSDACHSLAAATTLDIGLEEELIEEMEKILGS